MEAAHPIHHVFSALASDARFTNVGMSLTRTSFAEGEPTYLIRVTLPELARLDLLADLHEFAGANGFDGVMETHGGVAFVSRAA